MIKVEGMNGFLWPLLAAIMCTASSDRPVESLKAPPGFHVSVWAQVDGARSLARAGDVVFVSTGGFSNPMDRVYRVRDWNGNGTIEPDEVETLISGLTNPNGVAVRGKDLFVAERSRILQFSSAVDLSRGTKLNIKSAKVLPFKLPSESQHGWRYIKFAPRPEDDWLYVAIGAPCNVCKPPSALHATIQRVNVKSGKVETVARGVRNSVGMAFHPRTKNLWFTDNGRDFLGDDLPPDELNELSERGAHFGYPTCYGQRVHDASVTFATDVKDCASTVAPRADLGSHVAALGLIFYTGSQFPKEYNERIFIAEHGSWNRSRKSGYRVMSVRREGERWIYEPFITGWLDENTQSAWGRPVDLQQLEDGSLLVSDDTGAIYQVKYQGR